jgi:hypothetical protein
MTIFGTFEFLRQGSPVSCRRAVLFPHAQHRPFYFGAAICVSAY